MVKRIECVVKGRVQGVLYRDFTKRNAKKLGLFGEVKNLQTGSVSVIAEGEEENLKTLIAYLEKGSFFSEVHSVQVSWIEYTGEYQDFKIVFH